MRMIVRHFDSFKIPTGQAVSLLYVIKAGAQQVDEGVGTVNRIL